LFTGFERLIDGTEAESSEAEARRSSGISQLRVRPSQVQKHRDELLSLICIAVKISQQLLAFIH